MKEYSGPDISMWLPHLEHFPEPGGEAHQILLDPLPFQIGRCSTANYILYSRQISKKHTEIFRVGKEFRIRDLGSTNGTFVNGQRIQVASLLDGDIIHVGQVEFKFANEAAAAQDNSGRLNTELGPTHLPGSIIRAGDHLRELLDQERVHIVFQPIVDLISRKVLGYEALGRGAHEALSPNPGDLFRLASQLNLAEELSQLFRRMAIQETTHLPDHARIFINLHPTEMGPDLVPSLSRLRAGLRDHQRMVLEVHEGLVSNAATLLLLRDQLNELGIELAYDDFGAGQARLTELADAPPDFIKFDMSLIRGIDRVQARQDLVQAIIHVTKDLNVRTIAEGIETMSEASVCSRLGCPFGQGFLFGHPQTLMFGNRSAVV